jgi:hypothetical protein
VKIFLGGTRKVNRLPGEVIELMENYIHQKSEFLVGDAPGSDKAFQAFLAKYDCQVTVFSSAPYVRNNEGNWPTQLLDSGLKTKSNAMHSIKDRAMGELCNSALMMWDSQSVGTLTNVLDVISQGKTAYLYNWSDSELIHITDQMELDNLLLSNVELGSQAMKRLRRDKKRITKLHKSDLPKTDTLF